MKRILSFLVLVLCWVSSYAYDIAVKNADGKLIYYNYINNGTELEVTLRNYDYGEYFGSVVIPKEVDTHDNWTRKVTSIGLSAFLNCRYLTSITIPNSVTCIKGNAFYGCYGLTSVHISDLESWCKITFDDSNSNPLGYARHLFLNGEEIKDLVIPDCVTTIGNYAFYWCAGLTSVTIPNSVTSIGNSAFDSCSDLTLVTISNSVTSIGDHAFYACGSLTSITIPNSVTSIGNSAFRDCSGLTSVTIPNSVTNIGIQAFFCCSRFVFIEIPCSVTNIGYGVFAGCQSLASIIVDESNPAYKSVDGVLTTKDEKTLIAYPAGKEEIEYVIPNSITIIERYAFYNCWDLTSISIPNSVTSIGDHAFGGVSLTSVTIPNSVTSIGNYAFQDCRGLTSITISNSVLSIRTGAFQRCALTEVISKIENPFTIDRFTFSDNTFNNATLYVPRGTLDKYKATEGWKEFVNIVEGSPSGISNIENEGVKELKRYTLDGKVITDSHKGLNIIQMKNGTTKKVLSK